MAGQWAVGKAKLVGACLQVEEDHRPQRCFGTAFSSWQTVVIQWRLGVSREMFAIREHVFAVSVVGETREIGCAEAFTISSPKSLAPSNVTVPARWHLLPWAKAYLDLTFNHVP